MKNIRSFGSVEKREYGKYRARFTDGDSKISLGQFDSKEEAERALQEYMKKNNLVQEEEIEDVVGQASKPFAEIGLDGGEISTGVLTAPLTDWTSILLSFGLEVGNLMSFSSAKYLKGGSGNWQQGFGILYVKNKKVAPVFVPIEKDGSFIVEGKTYG